MTTVAPGRLLSTTVCAKAKSASRLPSTGSTCVAGSSAAGHAGAKPRGDGLAQRRRAGRRGIIGDPAPAAASASRMRFGVGCFGSPIDRLIGGSAGIRRDAGKEPAQPLERIRRKAREAGIQGRREDEGGTRRERRRCAPRAIIAKRPRTADPRPDRDMANAIPNASCPRCRGPMPLAVARRGVDRHRAGRRSRWRSRSRTGAGGCSVPLRHRFAPPETAGSLDAVDRCGAAVRPRRGTGAGRQRRAPARRHALPRRVRRAQRRGLRALPAAGSRPGARARGAGRSRRTCASKSVHNDGVRIRDHGEVRDIALRNQPSASPAQKRRPRARMRRRARRLRAARRGTRAPVYKLNAELLTGIASQTDSWKALLVADNGGPRHPRQQRFFDDARHARGRSDDAGQRHRARQRRRRAGRVREAAASRTSRCASREHASGKPAEWLFVNAGACSRLSANQRRRPRAASRAARPARRGCRRRASRPARRRAR